MKIGIDGTALTMSYPCGTKTYATNLLLALSKIDRENEYVVYAGKEVELPADNFRLVVIPHLWSWSKRQLTTIPRHLEEQTDIFHFLDPFGILLYKHPKSILTVHDLGLSVTHTWFGKNWYKRLFTEWALKKSINNANTYLVDSASIQNELYDYLDKKNILNRNCNLAYLGVNPSIKFQKKKKRDNQYFLALGDFAWRKNVPRIIEAYRRLSQHTQARFKLKIVVSSSRFLEPFEQYLSTINMSDKVELVTNISDRQLHQHYRQAKAFIYPSLYEGFGLPILEAMQNSCPVITSNSGATKEVSGKAALLVDPYNVDEITSSLNKIISDRKLEAKLVILGRSRAKQFTWKKTATAVLRTYQSVYKN